MMATPKPLLLLGLVALTGCGKWADDLFCDSAGCGWGPGEWQRVTALANPGLPPPDRSNKYSQIDFVQQLGQAFFFDTGFSGNATQKDAINRNSPLARAAKDQPIGVSCASCHDLSRAGVDTTSVPGHVSVGAGWTDVNALGVVNAAYRQLVFWNGRADSLWALNVVVSESATTMNGNRLALAHRIYDLYYNDYNIAFPDWPLDPKIPSYPASGKPKKAGRATPDGDWETRLSATDQAIVNRVLVNWAKAIAAYEYTLVSVNSPFDQYVTAGPDSDLISPAAKRGLHLFVGKAGCSDCHAGPMLTDELFHDIGVPQTGETVPTTADCPQTPSSDDAPFADCDCVSTNATKCAPWGGYDGLRRLRNTTKGSAIRNRWLRTGDPLDPDNHWSDDQTDTSRQSYVEMPLTDALKGAWRTPSLRNVALTAPYMHDGRYATLDEVLWHYNTAGHDAGPEQVGDLAAQMKPLGLTDAELADIIAFLDTLTGDPPPREWTTAPPPR